MSKDVALFLTVLLAMSLSAVASETGGAPYYHNSLAGNKTAAPRFTLKLWGSFE